VLVSGSVPSLGSNRVGRNCVRSHVTSFITMNTSSIKYKMATPFTIRHTTGCGRSSIPSLRAACDGTVVSPTRLSAGFGHHDSTRT